jgi:monothiol glutaredoxin
MATKSFGVSGTKLLMGFVQLHRGAGQLETAWGRFRNFSAACSRQQHIEHHHGTFSPRARGLRLYSAISSQTPSGNSHPDFQPQRKQQPSDADWADVMERIERDVMSSKVVLYMKGEPEAPLCGFSYKAVSILKAMGVPFQSYNVLADPLLREAIKKYSQWPTIPQLFVDGEFIGGSDIMESMYRSGELKQILGVYGKAT